MQHGQGCLTEDDIAPILEAEGLPRGSDRYFHALYQRYHKVEGTNFFIEKEEVDYGEGISYHEAVCFMRAEGVSLPESSEEFREKLRKRFSMLPNGRFCLRSIPL